MKEESLIIANQENMVVLCRKAHAIMELLEFDNKDL